MRVQPFMNKNLNILFLLLAAMLFSGCVGEHDTKIIYDGIEGYCTYTAYSHVAHCFDRRTDKELCSYEYHWSKHNGHWC